MKKIADLTVEELKVFGPAAAEAALKQDQLYEAQHGRESARAEIVSNTSHRSENRNKLKA